jgi:glutamine synthetase
MTPKDVIAMAKENNAKVVDIRYMDFIGTWQHFSVPCQNSPKVFLKTAWALTAHP